MTSKYYVCIVALLHFVMPRVFGNELSLPAYLTEVVSKNPSLAAIKSRQEAAQAFVSSSGSLDDPTISVAVEEIPVSGDSMSSVRKYQLAQNFSFPGKRGLKESVADKQALVVKANVNTTERELRVLATQIYYRVLYNQHAQTFNQELRSLLQTQISSSRTQYKLGEGTHHDWLVLKVTVGTLDIEASRLLGSSERVNPYWHYLMNYERKPQRRCYRRSACKKV